MKFSKRITALAITVIMLISCLAFSVSAAEFAMTEVGGKVGINDSVSYQRYSITSGVNENNVAAVALEFDTEEYIPMAFMAAAGTYGTLQAQVNRAQSKYGYEVVGAINGSFFSMDSDGRGAYGTLVDYIISNGKVMSAHAGNACEVVAFAPDGTFKVVNSLIDYKLYINGSEVPGGLYYINKTSGTKTTTNWGNGIYYYDTSCGRIADTNDNVKGYSVLCKKLDNTDLVVGGTMKAEVISVTEGTKAAQVSDGYDDVSDRFALFIKSESPNAKYVKDLEEGDSVSITVTETVEASREIIENANSVIENVGWLVKDGVDQTELVSSIGTHSVTLSARWTAFGRKADGSYVFFTSHNVSTDTYQTEKTPCITLKDVAKAMIKLGCVDVIRMDGGGSTAMYVTDDGTGKAGYLMVNEDYNRPVADCILIVKKSSLVNESLNDALKSELEKAKASDKASDAAVAAAIAEIEKYLDENEILISGDVRSLLMKLQSAMSGKDALAAVIAKAEGINYADYSEEVLTELRKAYTDAVAVFGDDKATSEEVTTAAETLAKWIAMSGEQNLPLSEGKTYTITTGGIDYANFNGVLIDDKVRLTDGKKDGLEGTSNIYSAWNCQNSTNASIPKQTISVTVDLGEETGIDTFSAHVAQQIAWGISTPEKVTVLTSTDGKDFTEVGSVSGEVKSTKFDEETMQVNTIGELVNSGGNSKESWRSFRIDISASEAVTARYVRFDFKTYGSFLWLSEVSASKTVKPVENTVFITKVNSTIYTSDAAIFTSAAGNLKDNDSQVNAKYTQNVFLKWSEEDGAYVVTSNVKNYAYHDGIGAGVAPNVTLAEDELLLAVHGDAGDKGHANRELAGTFQVGDKIGIYGVDIENGKIILAAYAVKIEDAEPAVEPEPEYTLGDINNDGTINTVDYIMAKRAIVGSYTLDETQEKAADVNGNGKVDTVDYIMIKRHIVGSYTIKQPGK